MREDVPERMGQDEGSGQVTIDGSDAGRSNHLERFPSETFSATNQIPFAFKGRRIQPLANPTHFTHQYQDLSSQLVDEGRQADLTDAVEVIQGVLQEANSAIDKETRQNALVDLNERVEEWKSLKLETFGELMLFGTFTVLKGDGGAKDQEKEVCLRLQSDYLELYC